MGDQSGIRFNGKAKIGTPAAGRLAIGGKFVVTPDSYQVRAKLIRAANADNLQGRLHLQIATLWLPATSRGDATAVF
jgi:hypothetical protein